MIIHCESSIIHYRVTQCFQSMTNNIIIGDWHTTTVVHLKITRNTSKSDSNKFVLRVMLKIEVQVQMYALKSD